MVRVINPQRTIHLEEFLPNFRMLLTGIPEPIAIDALRQAASEFCTKTRYWRERMAVDLVVGPAQAAPQFTKLVAIDKATMGGRKLTPIAYTDLDFDTIDMLDDRPATFISQCNRSEITVWPYNQGEVVYTGWLAPVSGSRFGVVAGFTQQDHQAVVPETIFDDFALELASGAAAIIAETPRPGQEDLPYAPVWRARFEKAIAENSDTLTGQQRATTRTKAHWL